MNKTMHKRIIGLLIVIFAFMVFTPENVFADEKCDKARQEFKTTGPKKYGIVNKVDKDKGKYILEILEDAKNNEFLKGKKVGDIAFKITEVKLNDQIVDGSILGIGTTQPNVLRPGDKIEIPESLLRILSKKSDGTVSIQFKLKPLDENFEDPDLKAACDSGKNFEYQVVFEYDYYDVQDVEWITYELDDDSSSSSGYVMNIDCNKSYDPKSFEYQFCDTKKKAEAAGAVKKTFGTKGDGHQVYSDLKIAPQNFKCDYKINRENPSIWKLNERGEVLFDKDGLRIPNPDYYANTSYLIGEGTFILSEGSYTYHVGDNKDSVYSEDATCEVKCDEIVVVEYGQPVASHGGLCFEYKVRVTSRVDCGYGKIKEPRKGAICVPTPYCIHTYEDGSTEVLTQGGPSDDFDECVEECDGGVYSDRCSNKCYKKVYGTSRLISQVSGYEIEYGTKVKYGSYTDAKPGYCKYTRFGWTTNNNGSDRYINERKVNCDAPQLAGKASVYSIYKSGIPAKPTCKDSCGWYANGSKDCLNPCLVGGGSTSRVAKSSNIDDDENEFENSKAESKKIADKWGEVTVDKTGNASSQGGACNIVYYNSQSTYERYHKTKNADGTPATNGRAKPWVILDKEKNQDTYNKLKERCKAAARCNTSTAEFTISASYINKETGQEVTINYPYDDKTDSIKYSNAKTTTCTSSQATFTTILDSDGCYNCVDGCDNENNPKDCRRWYRTEWSFPGVWENAKNSNIFKYKLDGSESGSYYLNPYKFCLPKYVGDVNQKWFRYYHKVAGVEPAKDPDKDIEESTTKTCPDGSKITCDTKSYYEGATFTAEDAKPIDAGGKTNYNIKATTRKFGFYEWDIDIECFYASDTSYEKNNCTCKSTNEGYRIKVVDLPNLLPDSEGNKLTSPNMTGRDPGFNWSSSATQTKKDPNYKSDPVTYTKWVQKKGYDVYKDDYLDYEIYLTKEDINTIKKMNVNYNDFKGSINDPSQIEKKSASTYQSKLIRETLKDHAKYPSYKALQCNNMKNYKRDDCEDFSEEGE